jgi:hypothetical protein
MERPPMFMDRQNKYYPDGHTTKNNTQIPCNPHHTSDVILYKNRKTNPKIQMKTQKSPNTQSNPKQKEQGWRYHKKKKGHFRRNASRQATNLYRLGVKAMVSSFIDLHHACLLWKNKLTGSDVKKS